MLKSILILLVIWSQTNAGLHRDDVTEGTELIMSFLIHRHGDRTPVESTVSYSTDVEALEALTAPYGYGQLTLPGKRSAYRLGQHIRQRYNELLSPHYNRSEVYIRSTDITRTKMTILTALAAIYPPAGETWNPKLAWEPVPYTTVPVKYDFNMALNNCPVFDAAYQSQLFTSVPEVSAKMSNVLIALSNQLGFDITNRPALVFPIYDVYTSQRNLGLKLTPELEDIFGLIEEAASESIALIFGLDEYIPLQAGVLLKEFYTYADLAISGEDTPRLRLYSAHDFNVYSFEAVTKVNRQGVPKYASAYTLELRKVTSTGKYVVLPVYLPSPREEVVYLQVEGCDVLCDYDQFVALTEGNSRDIDSWRDECGFTEDLVVDGSSED
ncbi:prostatic acid phosphatase-like [Plodia interpunctella]|uniref:prostatic acid phosphatase-like n=1 Tax=Plodia interpunctella TaxID=58824 RepID=UPI00236833FC|nr:prostatic acid phosphatase-like [Plodia interpunctella]